MCEVKLRINDGKNKGKKVEKKRRDFKDEVKRQKHNNDEAKQKQDNNENKKMDHDANSYNSEHTLLTEDIGSSCSNSSSNSSSSNCIASPLASFMFQLPDVVNFGNNKENNDEEEKCINNAATGSRKEFLPSTPSSETERQENDNEEEALKMRKSQLIILKNKIFDIDRNKKQKLDVLKKRKEIAIQQQRKMQLSILTSTKYDMQVQAEELLIHEQQKYINIIYILSKEIQSLRKINLSNNSYNKVHLSLPENIGSGYSSSRGSNSSSISSRLVSDNFQLPAYVSLNQNKKSNDGGNETIDNTVETNSESFLQSSPSSSSKAVGKYDDKEAEVSKRLISQFTVLQHKIIESDKNRRRKLDVLKKRKEVAIQQQRQLQLLILTSTKYDIQVQQEDILVHEQQEYINRIYGLAKEIQSLRQINSEKEQEIASKKTEFSKLLQKRIYLLQIQEFNYNLKNAIYTNIVTTSLLHKINVNDLSFQNIKNTFENEIF